METNELTWQDVKHLAVIADSLLEKDGDFSYWNHHGEQEYYEEVLKRYNEYYGPQARNK